MTDPAYADWAEPAAEQGEWLAANSSEGALLPDLRSGKAPDHRRADLEAETKLVAHYLVLCNAHPRSSQVKAHHFGWPAYRTWWARALDVKTIAQPSDIGMSSEHAAQLSDVYLPPSQVEATERRVIKAASARLLCGQIGEVERDLAANGAEYLDEAHERVRRALTLSESGLPQASRTQREVGELVVRQYVERVRDGNANARTIPMIAPLQAALGGWVRKKVHLIVGRSSEHKTTLLRASAEHAAREGFTVGGLILEDDAEDMASRTIAANTIGLTTRMLQAGLPPQKGSGRNTEHGLAQVMGGAWRATQEDYTTRMHWVEDGPWSLSNVAAHVKTMHSRSGIDWAYIDYAQLIQPDYGKADQLHWALVMATAQTLAKQLDIALVMSVQIDKLATRESLEDDARPPRTIDALGGACWYQGCFGSICIAKKEVKGRPAISWVVDKWKTGATQQDGFMYVTPERDRIEA